MISIKPVISATAFALTIHPIWAQDFNKGIDAYSAGDYAAVLQEWRQLADQRNARAQNNLGNMYYLGQGVAQDYILAHMWSNIAAANSRTAAETTIRGSVRFLAINKIVYFSLGRI